MPDLPTRSGAVFLSYAHEDDEAARRIAGALRGFGIEVWFDVNELRGGDAWDANIRRQIRESALFIPIISASTQARAEGYFRREWKLAVDRTNDMSESRAYLVPVIVDDTPEGAADVPEQFMKAQFTRLLGGAPTTQFVDNIKRLLQAPQGRVAHPSSGVATAPAAKAATVEGPDPKSVVVLPFVNRSADPDQEFFADGLAEDLLNLLAKVPELQVTSRSSAFSYKGSTTRLAQITRELNVANVLEGSVRRSGNRLRVTAQLIDARIDRQLWSEIYDRTMDDVFAVQDEITGAVVEQLKITLLGAVPKTKAGNPKAYALFLQARELSRHDTAWSYEQAVALHKQAIAIDPGLAVAWDGLAYCYSFQAGNDLLSNNEGYDLMRDALKRALEIDPKLAVAHAKLGLLSLNYLNDVATAARHFEHALSLEPTNTDIIADAINFARGIGRLDLSVTLAEYVVAHDPISSLGHGRLGGAYVRVGRYDEAIASMRTALRLSPGRSQTHYQLGLVLLLKGEPKAALAEMQDEPAESWRLDGLAMACHALGEKQKSDAALDELIKKCETEASWNIAYVIAYRGEIDRAFEWLDKALVYKDPGVSDSAITWQFKSLHGDPRWLPFLRKIGRAPEQLEAIQFDVKLPAR